ncbi:hypothetical protein OWM07_10745 [Deferribacter thermophilus]|uniref:DNA polymerase III subunit delta n=1 Tax=Deferribacter thermophilus TaxID=53573 RepID=UPI003C1E155A
MTTKKKILIIGSSNFIEEKLNELVPKDDHFEIKRFNEENFSLEEAVEFIFTYSLFYQDKYLIVKNIDKISDISKNAHHFVESGESHIIFTAENLKNVDKLIIDNFENVKEQKLSYKDQVVQIMEIFNSKGVKLEFNEAREIYELCGRNIELIKQEAEKISIYFHNREIESFDEIIKLISFTNVGTIFKFIESFFLKDKKSVLKYINDMVMANENFNMIFYIFSKRAIEIFYYKVNPDLVSGHAYKISQIKAAANKWKLEELSKLIEKLYNIDKRLKTSAVSLENELISFVSNL